MRRKNIIWISYRVGDKWDYAWRERSKGSIRKLAARAEKKFGADEVKVVLSDPPKDFILFGQPSF
jgi:hypothetical protein